MYDRYGTKGLLETNPAMAWIIIIVALAVVIFMIISMWKVFEKAGKPGWAAIIPIYSSIVLAEIAGKPIWMGLIMSLGAIIPVVGPIASIVFSVIVSLGVAENFNKSQGFGVGLALLGFIFYPMLAFGDATYKGAAKTNDELLDM